MVRSATTMLGFVPVANTPDQFGELIRVEIAKWAKVIKDAKIKPE